MSNISGWTEGILLSLAFVAVLGIVIGSFNYMYNKNYDVGLNGNSTEALFIEYQDSASQQITGGEVRFDTTEGVTLKSSFGIASDAATIVWSFLTGGWIEQIFSYFGAGESAMILAKFLRILYFLSLVSAILYAIFKVVL